MPRYLDPKSDVVFKKIFSQHPKLLKSFLNAVLPLPPDGLIEDLEYLAFEHTPVIPTFKNTIVDVKCIDQQGKIFIVEMQIQWVPNFMQRMLFGASQAYVKQLEKGEKYEYLNPVYGLGILASTFDYDTEDWYHHYKIVNVQRPERELKGLQLVFIELPKFKPNKLAEKKLQVLWLRFFSEVNEKSREIEPELFQVPEIEKAIRLAEEAGFSEGELASYDKYWDGVSTEKTMISGYYNKGLDEGRVEGRVEGRAEGRVEGRAEGRIEGLEEGSEKAKREIAIKLLSSGTSIDEVSQITGLSLNMLKNIELGEIEFGTTS